MRGHYTEPVTDETKERFLDLIASGHTRPEAAEALDASARVFRALCNPAGPRYDETFARQYAYLTEDHGEHEQALAERLQDEAIRRGLRSSDRLLEKNLAIYHRRWEIHRPQAFRMEINIDTAKMFLANMPDEMLNQYIYELEAKHQHELLEATPPPADADAA